MASRFFSLFFIVLMLSACQTTMSPQYIPQEPFIAISDPEIDEKRLYYMSAINAYHRSDVETVKMAYVQKINAIDGYSEDQHCSDAMMADVAEVLRLHPSSMVAHSINRGCATLRGEQALIDASDEAISIITEILLGNGIGDTQATSIATRELYEAQFMLQWADIDVFDVELVPTKSGNYLLNHAVDEVEGQYTYFYSDISRYFKAYMYSVTGFKYNDRMLAQLFRTELVKSGDATSSLWRLRNAMYSGDYDYVINNVVDNLNVTPIQIFLLSQAHFNKNNMDEFDALADRVIDYTQVGVVDAEVFFALILLENDIEQISATNTLLSEHIDQFGAESTVDFWLKVLLAQDDISPSQQQWLAQLPDNMQADLTQGITRWTDNYPIENAAMQARLNSIYQYATAGGPL